MIYACVAFAINTFCGFYMFSNDDVSMKQTWLIIGFVSFCFFVVSFGYSLFFVYMIGVTSIYKNKEKTISLLSKSNIEDDKKFIESEMSNIVVLKKLNVKYRKMLYFKRRDT